MLRLALHGPKLSGKSTLAIELEARGFQRLNFTDLIKELFCAWADLWGVSITVEDIYADKEAYRPDLIAFANAAGFDDGFGVEMLIDQIDPNATGVVFDNVRTEAQWKLLKAAGFTLVRLTTEERFRVARAMTLCISREDFLATADSFTEMPLPTEPDEIRLHQAGPIDDVLNDLAAKVIERAVGTPTLKLKPARKRGK